MKQETVLVLGASPNPERYSYKAVQKLRAHGHRVIAVGKKTGQIGDVSIQKEIPLAVALDTVTLYLNPDNQKEYYSQLVDLKPTRVIYNPGTENEELEELIEAKGIENLIACTLVLLSTGQY